jgi:hypothetical protein
MNCKPGDLAFVISDDFPENVGRMVSVLRRVPDTFLQSNLLCWEVEVAGSTPLRVYERDKVSIGSAMVCGTYDYQLRPIRAPGITTEEVKELFSPSPAKESEKV